MKPKSKLKRRPTAECPLNCRYRLTLFEAENAYGRAVLDAMQGYRRGESDPVPPPWLTPESPFYQPPRPGEPMGWRCTVDHHPRRSRERRA